jgi:CHAT domain-containing protein
MIEARLGLGRVLVGEHRWAEGAAEFEAVDANVQSDAELVQHYKVRDIDWGMALIKMGQAAKAVPMLEELANQTTEQLSESTYQSAQAHAFYAMALAATGDKQRGLAELARAVPVLLAKGREAADEGADGANSLRTVRLRLLLEAYMDLLAGMVEGKVQVSGVDPLGESFRIADVARGSGVQRAVIASAARASIKDPNLAKLARREQDDGTRLGVLTSLLGRLVSAPRDEKLPKIVAEVSKEIQALRESQRRLKAEIEQRFSDYANLIDPKPATLEQTRAALKEGEALVSIYVGDAKAFVWAIPKTGTPAFGVASLDQMAVAKRVAQLRLALDVDSISIAKLPQFDTAEAYALYRDLLEPVAAGWKGAKNLLIVPHLELGQLPFALLLTANAKLESGATRYDGYRKLPWLIREASITQLPSVNALVTLRAVPPAAAGRREFAGFGDAYFTKEQAAEAARENSTRVAMTEGDTKLRNLSIRKVALRNKEEASAATSLPNAPVENSFTIADLPRLPDTADEIREIAQALKADPAQDVFLGVKANEKTVKNLDLSNRKVIVFATHGLVPGDLNGLDQPALALSAPEVANIEGDGLLTMEEILGLKLNADWVVLSACNTASGQGAGSEAVSGLGRAFFYAGARSLLVSNWAVETVSARLLTTGVFEYEAKDSTLSRAQALQRTMLGLINGTRATATYYAHPMFWAPFSLIGDSGGR